MSFGEALMQVLSFFWSPVMAIIVLAVFILAGLVVALEEWGERWGSAIVGVLMVVVCGVVFAALAVYLTSNGVGPLSWEVSS